MRSHDQVIKKLMRRPGVRVEVERLEREEFALLDALIKARQEAGRTQRFRDLRRFELELAGTHQSTARVFPRYNVLRYITTSVMVVA